MDQSSFKSPGTGPVSPRDRIIAAAARMGKALAYLDRKPEDACRLLDEARREIGRARTVLGGLESAS